MRSTSQVIEEIEYAKWLISKNAQVSDKSNPLFLEHVHLLKNAAHTLDIVLERVRDGENHDLCKYPKKEKDNG